MEFCRSCTLWTIFETAHYEDALRCMEYRISDCRRIMADHVQTQNRLHTGTLMNRDKVILKKDPDYAEELTKWIADCAEKIATI